MEIFYLLFQNCKWNIKESSRIKVIYWIVKWASSGFLIVYLYGYLIFVFCFVLVDISEKYFYIIFWRCDILTHVPYNGL